MFVGSSRPIAITRKIKVLNYTDARFDFMNFVCFINYIMTFFLYHPATSHQY